MEQNNISNIEADVNQMIVEKLTSHWEHECTRGIPLLFNRSIRIDHNTNAQIVWFGDLDSPRLLNLANCGINLYIYDEWGNLGHIIENQYIYKVGKVPFKDPNKKI